MATRNMYGLAVYEICKWTDRQTEQTRHRHTHCNTLHLSQEQSNELNIMPSSDTLFKCNTVINRVKVLRPTQHKISHFRNVPQANFLA